MLTIEAEAQMKEIARLYKEAADALGYFIGDHMGAFTVPGRMAIAVERIREEHAVYLIRSGRMCVAGLNPTNLEAVARALSAA